MPPVISGNRLRRVNSSTLSLNKTKKKLLTVEELYVEVLYTVLHMIGCDIDQVCRTWNSRVCRKWFQVNETELINYVQEAFHMESEKHQQLLEIATMKEVLLNCETPFSLIFNHVYNIYQIHGISLDKNSLSALLLCSMYSRNPTWSVTWRSTEPVIFVERTFLGWVIPFVHFISPPTLTLDTTQATNLKP